MSYWFLQIMESYYDTVVYYLVFFPVGELSYLL